MVLRAGIIGLGGVSEAHLSAYQLVDGIEVVAASEPRQQRLDEMSTLHGFRAYTDYQTMLENEDLDVVCVLVPASLHREVAQACAEAGVHVFCEKPIAISLADAEQMVSVCEQHGVKFFYGASYRFLPAIQKARELISSNTIGEVMLMTETVLGGLGLESHVSLGFVHYPEGGPGGSGMGLVDHGIHMIDLFPWLTGSEIVNISGRGNISGQLPATEHVHMDLANGAVGQLLYNDCTFATDLPAEGIFSQGASWDINGPVPADTWHPHPGCIHVYGSEGSLRIFHYANQLFLNDQDGLHQVQLPNRPPPVQFGIQMESFIQSIQEDRPSSVTGQDGINALRALLAIYENY
jgi:predicted dehydrogenase